MSAPDTLIIGAGPAGAAAAIGLRHGGASVLLIDSARETGDALCGGFLSWHSLARLGALGIAPSALGGQIVTRLRLFAGDRQSETPLPQPGIGLSRRRLDSILQAAACAAGAGLERGVHAAAIDRPRVRMRDGAHLSAPALFLAAGKHGFRGMDRTPYPRLRRDPVMGLRLRLPAHDSLARLVGDAVELHLFDRGYAGLVRHEDGSGNLCLAVHKSRIDACDGKPGALLRALGKTHPHLGERLAYADWSRPIDAIGHVPYGWRAQDSASGLFLLGDQAGVIPSLAGEGMGLALASAADAVKAWQRGGAMAAQPFQHRLAQRMRRPFAIANLVWRLGESPLTAGTLAAAARQFPNLVQTIARITRID